jgi:hypothetical protein
MYMYSRINGSYSGNGYARLGIVKAMSSDEYQGPDEFLVREGLNKKDQKPFIVKWDTLSDLSGGIEVKQSNADSVYLRNSKIQPHNFQ